MRARELLQEDYSQSLQSDLDNILAAAAGSGATQVDTNQLVSQLYSMGYAVDSNNIMGLLNNSPMVSNATPQAIMLKGQEGANGQDEVDSAEKVSDMAQNATDIG